MKTKIIIFLIFALGVLLNYSCGKDYLYNKNIKLITKDEWRISTFVDYSQNNVTDIRPTTFLFKQDGTLIKVYDNKDTIVSDWEMTIDPNYIIIGTNTFKITSLTNKALSLRYGDVEMFFVKNK